MTFSSQVIQVAFPKAPSTPLETPRLVRTRHLRRLPATWPSPGRWGHGPSASWGTSRFWKKHKTSEHVETPLFVFRNLRELFLVFVSNFVQRKQQRWSRDVWSKHPRGAILKFFLVILMSERHNIWFKQVSLSANSTSPSGNGKETVNQQNENMWTHRRVAATNQSPSA